MRARKPCRRFWTLLEGLNVRRGAPSSAEAENVRICNDGAKIVDVFEGVGCGSLGWEVSEKVEKPRFSVDINERQAVDGEVDRDLVVMVVTGVLLTTENALCRISLAAVSTHGEIL